MTPHEYFRHLKKMAKLTNQEIADLTKPKYGPGLTKGLIDKYSSGHATPSPAVLVIMEMICHI